MTEQEKESQTKRMVKAMKESNELTRDCVTTAQLGRQLGMSARELYKELCRQGILYYAQHKYLLCNGYDFQGLMLYRFFIYYSKDGERKLRMYPVWTSKGVSVIRNLITKHVR